MSNNELDWLRVSLASRGAEFLFDLCEGMAHDVVIICGNGNTYDKITICGRDIMRKEFYGLLYDISHLIKGVLLIMECERKIHHYIQDGTIKPSSKILFVSENEASETIQGMIEELSPSHVDWATVGGVE